MLDKSLLWYILETDGRSRQIVNGVVTSKSKKTPLPDEPIGGDDILIKYQRNINRHSVDRSYSLPIEFPKRSALILRDALYRNNIDRKLELLIQQFQSVIIDPSTFKDRHEYLYKGDIDFSTSEDFPEENKFKVNLLDFGISQLVKAAANTEYFIPFDDDAKIVKMDGIEIDSALSSIVTTGTSTNPLDFFGNHIIESDLIQSEIGYAGGAKSVSRTKVTNNNSNIRDTGQYFFKATTNGSIEFVYNIDMNIEYTPSSPAINPAAVYRIVIRRINSSGVGDNIHVLFEKTAAEIIPGAHNMVSTGVTATVNEGDELYLYSFCNVEGATGDAQLRVTYDVINSNLFKATYRYLHPTTYIKSFTASDLFRKLCSRMGIPANKLSTPLLDNCGIVFSSGDGIRGIDNAGIKTKYNDFEKFIINTLFGRVAIRDTIRVEDRLTAYDISGGTTSLGKVKGLKPTPAADMMYSSIKAGWKLQDIEDVNGKYDPNGVIVLSTPVKRGEGKELDLTCPYKAGPYEIEIKRINLDGRTSTDDNADNEVYAIAILPSVNLFNISAGFYSTGSKVYYSVIDYDPQSGQRVRFSGTTSNNIDTTIVSLGYEPLVGKYFIVSSALTDETTTATMEFIGLQQVELDRSITVTAGVPSPETIFNIPLTPGRILQRHLRWIRSFLYNYEPESIIFESGNRNTDLVAGGLVEKANISIADMGDRIFIPYYMEFTSKVRSDFGNIMDTTPDKAFDWDSKDNWKGFLLDGGLAANKKTPQVFKMLLSADNDITRLVQ